MRHVLGGRAHAITLTCCHHLFEYRPAACLLAFCCDFLVGTTAEHIITLLRWWSTTLAIVVITCALFLLFLLLLLRLRPLLSPTMQCLCSGSCLGSSTGGLRRTMLLKLWCRALVVDGPGSTCSSSSTSAGSRVHWWRHPCLFGHDESPIYSIFDS